MKSNVGDKTVSRIFRKRARQKVEPKLSRKLREDLHAAIKKEPEANRDVLIQAFELIRFHFDEPGRVSSPEYVVSVQKLITIEYLESAIAFFMACVTSIANVELESLTEAMPNDTCINRWIKCSKAQKRTVLKSISSSYDKYYKTAWCDWYIKKAPVKDIMSFAILTLKNLERPQYLPEASKLLVAVLSRDRKFVLTDSLKIFAMRDPSHIKALLLASSHVARVGEAYARGFGHALASEANGYRNLIHALDELLRSQDATQSEFAAKFATHVATTWCLVADNKRPGSAEVGEALLGFGIDAWLLGKGEGKLDLWFACTTGKISEMILKERGKISTQGALQIALGLRSAETDVSARDALWSSAFNLGIREIGQVGEIESFEPRQHEDIKGGLLPGDKAQIIHCGWGFGESVLLRAQVVPEVL